MSASPFLLRNRWGNITREVGGNVAFGGVAVVMPRSPTGYEIRSIIASINAERLDALTAAEVNGGSTLLIARGDIGDNSQAPLLVGRPYDTPAVQYDEVMFKIPVQTNDPLVLSFPPGTSPFTVGPDQPLVVALADARDELGQIWTNGGYLSLTVFGRPLLTDDDAQLRIKLR